VIRVNAGIAEIVGLFLVVTGCCTIVGAAALVSVALAVLAAGAFLILAGVVVTYVAVTLDRAKKPVPPGGERR
jgi:hypothetical protein